MAPIPTQSIAVIGAQVMGTTYPAQQVRSTEAAQAAGIQTNQMQARANSSATQARSDKNRAIAEEKRTEGVFADQSLSEEDDKHGSEQQPRQGKLNKVA
jgi:hypothetical protein